MAATIPGAGITTPLTLTTDDNTDTLTLVSTDTDANYGPNIEMSRPVTGATNDLLGRIDFSGRDDAGNTHNFFSIEAIIADASSGSEDGRMLLRQEIGGQTKNMIDLNGSEIVLNEDAQAIPLRVESANAAKAFFVNGNYAHAHISGTSSGSSTKVSYYSNGLGSIQLGVGGTIASYDYGVVDGPYLWHNIYADGSNGKKYIGAGEAATYGMYDGIHLFYTSASGSGDASVTQNERFRIANNGDLTATDTSIGSNSDQRLKKDIVDHTYDINKFKAFKPRSFAWIHPEAHTNEATTGFVAQEIESTDADWAYDIPWDSHGPDDKGPKEDEEKALCNGESKKASKLGKKDAMYISVIQQIIARIEALESA